MKKFLSLLIIDILFFTNAIGATANCFGGKCDFTNSYHYEYATTHCQQTLSYEKVETNFLYFTISKTGQQCDVLESIKEK